uniref:Uncharacterized protein n=1 Tax=Rhizophora mucronata TaxID=61149 RepID=A0A2P2P5E3_RHIMU
MKREVCIPLFMHLKKGLSKFLKALRLCSYQFFTR